MASYNKRISLQSPIKYNDVNRELECNINGGNNALNGTFKTSSTVGTGISVKLGTFEPKVIIVRFNLNGGTNIDNNTTICVYHKKQVSPISFNKKAIWNLKPIEHSSYITMPTFENNATGIQNVRMGEDGYYYMDFVTGSNNTSNVDCYFEAYGNDFD